MLTFCLYEIFNRFLRSSFVQFKTKTQLKKKKKFGWKKKSIIYKRETSLEGDKNWGFLASPHEHK